MDERILRPCPDDSRDRCWRLGALTEIAAKRVYAGTAGQAAATETPMGVNVAELRDYCAADPSIPADPCSEHCWRLIGALTQKDPG